MGFIFVFLAVFLLAVISPHLAGKMQKKTNDKAGWLKYVVSYLWDPLEWVLHQIIEGVRKFTVVFADWGKVVRHKLDRHTTHKTNGTNTKP